ncbi:MAG: YesL family protein [Bacillota bacterium]
MGFKGYKGKLYEVSEYITTLAYLNLLWLFFTLIGGVILGIHPATATLFITLRRCRKEDVYAVDFKSFKRDFKNEFKKANVIGVYLTGVLALLVVNGALLFTNEAIVHPVIAVVYVLSIVLAIILLIYVYAVYEYFDKPAHTIIAYAIIIGMANPLVTVPLILLVMLLSAAIYSTSGLPIFFGVSATAFVIVKYASGIFLRLENKALATDKLSQG